MTQLTDKIYAIEVPDDLLSPEFCFEQSIGRMLDGEKGDDELVIRYREKSCGSPIGKLTIPVPANSYRFLFTTKTATEEDAASVVQIISNGKISGRPQYRRYDRDNELPARMWTRDARHSLETLLRSKGLDPDKNYSIIEKL